MRAAVLYETGEPLRIEEIEVPKPQTGEVLVKLVATGVCHTDYAPYAGIFPLPVPMVLGHEGAGIVEEVGPGVTTLEPGDHVVLFVIPPCGKCRYCLEGKPYICKLGAEAFMGGTYHDGKTRLRTKGGEEVYSLFCQSSFAEYALVYELAAVKVPDDAPLDKVCLLACGASTGFGAVVNKAKVPAGAYVAILGCGGVGLSAVMGARAAGASKIIGIDVVDKKLEFAKELGATHTINAATESVIDRIMEETDDGCDYSFECIGKGETVALALDCVHVGGTAVVIGLTQMNSMIEIDAVGLLFDKTLTGCVAGSTKPKLDIPRYVELYKEGKLLLDKLVTRTYKLEQINEAFHAMEKGEVARSVIVF